MPLLSYRCPECDMQFEELVKSPRDFVACPRCGARGERLYQGRCAFGAKRSDGAAGASACAHGCAGCKGCGGTK